MNFPETFKITAQQKTRLSASSLTEYNASTLHLGLSINILPQNTNNVNNVDPTGIEPANPDFSDLGVHQHRAHIIKYNTGTKIVIKL